MKKVMKVVNKTNSVPRDLHTPVAGISLNHSSHQGADPIESNYAPNCRNAMVGQRLFLLRPRFYPITNYNVVPLGV